MDAQDTGGQVPTVGRVVHYGTTPQAAIVTAVHSDGRVTLRVFTSDGDIEFAARRVEFSPVPRMLCWSWPPRPARAGADATVAGDG